MLPVFFWYHQNVKSKVAIIRGSSLNSWEMQNYAPLAQEFDLLAIGSEEVKYDTAQVGFPIAKLKTLADMRSKLGPLKKLPLMGRLSDRFLHLDTLLSDVDIVHSAETFNVYSEQAADLKSRCRFKLVLTVWENIPFLWNGVGSDSGRVHRRKQKVIQATDHFIAITERAKAALLLEGVDEKKISVVPMGIDIERFTPQAKDTTVMQRFDLSEKDFVILSVGFLSWYKGMQDLIYAAGRLKQQGLVDKHHLKFVIVGDGPDKAEIYRLIDRVGVRDIFRTVEKVPYEDMVRTHNLADIFYLGSWPAKVWQEQFGMVLLEAMACGKPIVAAESGSIPEVVGPKKGPALPKGLTKQNSQDQPAAVLVPPADFYQLSRVLANLITNQTRRVEMGLAGRERVKENFTDRKIASQIGVLYNTLFDKVK